jgi:Fe-S-cluster containining protein
MNPAIPSERMSERRRAYLLGGRPILFPFLSGILRYDCDTCDAPCCKGAALGIGRSLELVQIQHAQPKAPLFAVPTFFGSRMMALASPAERCWFLGRKNKCRLEKVLGRDAKPAGCRLFPFVRFRSAGEHVVVLPDFTCPIFVAESPSSTGKTSHDEIALEMHRTQLPRSGHPGLVEPRDLKWGDAAVLEKRIVEEGERFLAAKQYADYAELQHVLALSALALDDRPGQMMRIEAAARRFTGIEEPLSQKGVHELIAVTGVLRFMASPLPRREMAGVLVALSVLLAASEHMRGHSTSTRTAPSLLESRLPFLYVLSHLASRPVLRRGTKKGVDTDRLLAEAGAVRPELALVAKDIERNGRKSFADTLEDLLRKHALFNAPMSADAIATLHGLGTILLRAGQFVPV